MTSDLDICSNALIKLDAEPIQSFDDRTREAEVMSQIYVRVRDDALTEFRWNFNTLTEVLNQERATPVNPNWTYQFLLPANLLHLINVIDQSGRSIPYRMETGRIFSNVQIRLARHQRRIREIDFPVYFQSMLVAKLAYERCEAIRGEGAMERRRWDEYQYKLRVAKRKDAEENPPVQVWGVHNRPWIAARQGSGYYWGL